VAVVVIVEQALTHQVILAVMVEMVEAVAVAQTIQAQAALVVLA
jgi:hypothetical protein